MKSWRQSQILEVIDHEPVASQEALRKMLETRGIEATQAGHAFVYDQLEDRLQTARARLAALFERLTNPGAAR